MGFITFLLYPNAALLIHERFFSFVFFFNDRTPALSVQSVCLSISSMLSSCREKKRPPDNTLYVRTCNKNPKKTKWWYHGMYEKSMIFGWMMSQFECD